MEEIAIVRKRSQVWTALLIILLLAAIVLAVLWFMGSEVRTDIGWNGLIEVGRESINGTA